MPPQMIISAGKFPPEVLGPWTVETFLGDLSISGSVGKMNEAFNETIRLSHLATLSMYKFEKRVPDANHRSILTRLARVFNISNLKTEVLAADGWTPDDEKKLKEKAGRIAELIEEALREPAWTRVGVEALSKEVLRRFKIGHKPNLQPLPPLPKSPPPQPVAPTQPSPPKEVEVPPTVITLPETTPPTTLVVSFSLQQQPDPKPRVDEPPVQEPPATRPRPHKEAVLVAPKPAAPKRRGRKPRASLKRLTGLLESAIGETEALEAYSLTGLLEMPRPLSRPHLNEVIEMAGTLAGIYQDLAEHLKGLEPEN